MKGFVAWALGLGGLALFAGLLAFSPFGFGASSGSSPALVKAVSFQGAPTAYAWSDFLSLESNTGECLGSCEAVLVLKNPTAKSIALDSSTLRVWYDKAIGASNLYSLDVLVLKQTPYQENVTDYVDVPTAISVMDNATKATQLVVVNRSKAVGSHLESRVSEEWLPLSQGGWSVPAMGQVKVKLVGKRAARVGSNNVDWKVSFNGFEPPWDWWNGNWNYRQQLTVTNNNPGETLGSNYTVELTLDTASLVNGGQLRSDCKDLRVVYDTGTTTELDRQIVGCNTASTKVRYRLQAGIGGGGSSTAYWIYIGNSGASAGPTDLNSVYAFWEDFNGTSLNSSRWKCERGGTTCTVSNGNLHISSTSVYSDGWLTLNLTSYGPGTEVTIGGNSSNGCYYSVGYGAAAENKVRITGVNSGTQCVYKTTVQENTTADLIDTTADQFSGTGYKLQTFKLNATDVRHYFNDVLNGTHGYTDFSPVPVRFYTWTQDAQHDIYLDNVTVRPYVYPEPTVTLGVSADVGGLYQPESIWGYLLSGSNYVGWNVSAYVNSQWRAGFVVTASNQYGIIDVPGSASDNGANLDIKVNGTTKLTTTWKSGITKQLNVTV